MGDKDVERNVRSTTEEGIKTPTQQHVHGVGEQHAITFGEKTESKKNKGKLIDKFRRREQQRKGIEQREGETGERGADREAAPD
jgi:hypothetical protein